MNISNYLATNKPERVVVTVSDQLNDGFTRKKAFNGACLVRDFKLESDYRCEAQAYVTEAEELIVLIEGRNGETDFTMYGSVEEFLNSDEAENLKSAVAAELGVEYVEEL